MFEVYQTDAFANWFRKLKDRKVRALIQARTDRLELGYFGDVEALGDNVFELRFFHGPGHRVYFTKRSAVIVILLTGGNKSPQKKDIAKAKALARQMEE